MSKPEQALSGGSPQALTMERLGDKDELIVAQSTSQCCRFMCFQPSINWVLNESDNFAPGTNPHDLSHSGWIHEESSCCMRSLSCWLPGCREVRYVQHGGPAPDAILGENQGFCFQCQTSPVTDGLSDADRDRDVVATHSKGQTCGACCCYPPYLETRDADGKVVGKTQYICDAHICVPKFDVLDAEGTAKYRIRPDTCVAGCCVQCRCGGAKGKCCKVPFLVRDPATMEPVKTKAKEGDAQVTQLFAGWANECCSQKNAYHLAFPEDATPELKLTLIGSSILLDVVFSEQDDGGGGDSGE